MNFSSEVSHSQNPLEFANQKTTPLPRLSWCCQHQSHQSLLGCSSFTAWTVAPHTCWQNPSTYRGICGCLQWESQKKFLRNHHPWFSLLSSIWRPPFILSTVTIVGVIINLAALKITHSFTILCLYFLWEPSVSVHPHLVATSHQTNQIVITQYVRMNACHSPLQNRWQENPTDPRT